MHALQNLLANGRRIPIIAPLRACNYRWIPRLSALECRREFETLCDIAVIDCQGSDVAREPPKCRATKTLCLKTATGINPHKWYIFYHFWFCGVAGANHFHLYNERRVRPWTRCLFIVGPNREWRSTQRGWRAWRALIGWVCHHMSCTTHQQWIQWQIQIKFLSFSEFRVSWWRPGQGNQLSTQKKGQNRFFF